jgi:hypothetical protein
MTSAGRRILMAIRNIPVEVRPDQGWQCARGRQTRWRAGFAGGLRPCLTAATRIASQNLVGTKKRPITAEQRNATLNDELSRYTENAH